MFEQFFLVRKFNKLSLKFDKTIETFKASYAGFSVCLVLENFSCAEEMYKDCDKNAQNMMQMHTEAKEMYSASVGRVKDEMAKIIVKMSDYMHTFKESLDEQRNILSVITSGPCKVEIVIKRLDNKENESEKK